MPGIKLTPEFTSEDLNWELEVEIDVLSFHKQDMQEQIQKWTMVLQMFAQLPPVLGPNARIDLALQKFLKALDIPSPGQLVGNSVDQQLLQMSEIVQMVLSGQPVPINPEDVGPLHVQIIDMFMNADLWGQIPPEGRQAILEHRTAHVEQAAAQEAVSHRLAGAFTPNPEGASLANQARREAAFKENALGENEPRPFPGGSNEF